MLIMKSEWSLQHDIITDKAEILQYKDLIHRKQTYGRVITKSAKIDA